MKDTAIRFSWVHLAASALSGIMLACAYALHPLAVAAWLGAVPVLWAAGTSRPLPALLYGGLTGLIASLSLLPYLTRLSGLPAALSLSVLRAVVWALGIWLASFAGRRLPRILSLFAFPALMAGLDLLTSLLSPHNSGGSIAYSQMDVPQVLRLASLGSTPLITLFVLLISSLISHVLLHRQTSLPGIGLSLLLMAGLLLLSGSPHPAVSPQRLQVGLLASDRHPGVPEDWRSVWQDYRQALVAYAGENEVMVLPEKLFQIPEADMPELLGDIQQIAHQYNTAIVIGLDERTGETAYNRAYIITPEGVVHHHDKIHMIPGAEDYFEQGQGPLQVPYRGLSLGLAICKDLDFPQTLRACAGSDLMLVQAWDFYEDDWFHSRMAIMRGVETGFPLVRSARRGFLTMADASGRVLAETESRSADMAYLSQPLETGHQPTMYSRIGDAFGWLALAYVVTVMLVAVSAGRRRGREEKLSG